MKYRVSRKINLSNIDAKLWPYETEDIEVSDADSFEEAQKKVDQYYNERIGYYKAMAEKSHQPQPALPLNPPTTGGPAPYPATVPLSTAPVQQPATPGFGTQPPAEFNV